MKIFLASHQSILLIRSGPSYKFVEMKRSLEKYGIDVRYFNALNQNLDVLNADLVHIFAIDIGIYPFAKHLKKCGIKFVVNPVFFSRHRAGMLRAYLTLEYPIHKFLKGTYSDYRIIKEICDCAEKVLPNTEAERHLLSAGLGVDSAKMKVIHNGVEKRFLCADTKLFEQKYGVENFILNVGHIGGPRKNVLALIRALAKINHPAVIIADIANTKESKICLQEAKLNKNLIIIKGFKHDDPMLASAYAACDTFVLPSRYETPGRAALEAGLAGAKIVITKYGGTKEYFENMAEYVNPYSIDSIVHGIEKALNSKKNDKLRNHIKKHFIWDKITKETIRVYKQVLSNGKSKIR
ncbi:MAG: glycosyltransferase [Candidatus Cloacimonetes bacterium]|nr:glycosyltransferase [Candidatus Cloacimonadota bacterium]